MLALSDVYMLLGDNTISFRCLILSFNKYNGFQNYSTVGVSVLLRRNVKNKQTSKL